MDEQQNILNNIFISWKVCKENHTFIDNISNSILNFGEIYEINSISIEYDNNIDVQKRTIYIDNCKNSIVTLYKKFNHLILLNSENIDININEGLISGIDIIHSNNININIKNNKINLTSFGYSDFCTVVLDDLTSKNIYINTNYCHNINFNIITENIINQYFTNRSLFSGIKLYLIDDNMIIACQDNFSSYILNVNTLYD